MEVILIILIIIFLVYVINNNINKSKQKDHCENLLNKKREENISKTVIEKKNETIEVHNPISKNIPITHIQSRNNKSYLFQGYSDKRWTEKCKKILLRDNFTCKCCQKMNPSKAPIFISKEIDGTSYYEIHEYNMLSGEYSIYSTYSGLKVILEFVERIWMPILQVHHKKYIQGINVWENEDDDLITLCQNCHKQKHAEEQIPIFSLDDTLVGYLDSSEIEPDTINIKNNERFLPWSIISKTRTKGRDYSNEVYITLRIAYLGIRESEQANELAKGVAMNFLSTYFPKYKFKISRIY